MHSTFGERVIEYNVHLEFKEKLPVGFKTINPFSENPETVTVMKEFYTKYFSDNKKRVLLLGINPGRHGAAVTGIPFTDTKRLKEYCDIEMKSEHSHEISSVFIYDMIATYGSVEEFYKNFYINSPFPLAIIRKNSKGNWVNANYYDDKFLYQSLKDYMIEQLRKNIAIGVSEENVFILGKKNAEYIQNLNKEVKLFERLTILPHPRYIQQYHSKDQKKYIEEYINAFNQ